MTNTDKNISKQNQKELLESLESWFSDCVSFDKEWKDKAKDMYARYHGTQWTSDEISELKDRKQAVTTFNHISPAIDSIIGGERQNRPKIKMAGRTLDDEQVAEVKTNLYDYIQYNSNTDDELDMVIKDCLVAGRGTMYIEPSIDKDEKADIRHSWIDYRDMFIDPLSKRDDLRDCRHLHFALFVDEDIVDKNFRKYNPDEDGHGEIYSFETSSEDELWFEKGNRKRPRLITSWYMDEKGDISMCIWVKGKILYRKKKPYELNKYPYVQITYKRNLDNAPYGMVKSMLSAQDEINKRHSKALHYLNASQVLAEENAFVDWNEAKKTLAKPDGITKLQDGALAEGRVQILPTAQLADSHIKLMQIAEQKLLSSAGINPAYVGQSGQYESAKKSQINISQASNTLVPFLNKLRIFRWELADKTMKLVPEFFTDEQLVRILNPDGSYAFMPVNEVVILDDGTLTKVNDITVDDVDIIIEDAPKGLNEKEEQFMQLMQIQGQTSRPIPMEILLRYSSLKDKYSLAGELEQYYGMEAQLQQAQQQMEAMAKQIQDLGGVIDQQQNNIVQINTARQVEKEVNKKKEKLNKELGL
jgi:hypothetical protein